MSDRPEHTAALVSPLAELPDPLPISVVARVFDVSVRPPGSKSITNRALLLAALAHGTTELRGALTDADDAQVMLRAIGMLGAKVEGGKPVAHAPGSLRITGVGGRWAIGDGRSITLDLHNAGTATRFLTAAAMLAPEGTSIVIDGDARMRERPIGELTEVIQLLADDESVIEFLGREGYPPVRVHGGRINWPEIPTVVFGRTQSSQFISAMLLAAPFVPGGLLAALPAEPGGLTSEPYVEMTLAMLSSLGVTIDRDHPSHRAIIARGYETAAILGRTAGRPAFRTVRVAPAIGVHGEAGLQAFTMDIEPDASGATYFEAAALLAPHGGRCTIEGLDLHPSRPSLQGDTQFVSVITAAGGKVERLNRSLRVIGNAHGTITPFDVDLADMPDTAMTAAVLAACASPPSPTADNPTATSVLHGLRTLRVKETDRLAALKRELEKVGAKVEIFKETWRGVADEGLRITASVELATLGGCGDEQHCLAQGGKTVARGDKTFARVEFDTYKDHRMAMALALIGLRRPNVWIRDPKCVAKTYPTFFAELARLYERTVS